LLTSTSAAHLAYTGKDGTPRVIPVGFFWTGNQVVISSATTSPKVTALSARPDVALAIDAGDTPDQARALSIRGRASVEIVDGVVEEYLAAARGTMDAEAAAEFEHHVRGMYDQMARIAIPPALGALLRLRRWPNAAFPAGTGRAEPVLTVGRAHARGRRTPPIGERQSHGRSHRPVRQSNRITALIRHGSVASAQVGWSVHT
jgi:Pyridoxamine 5'-phosphate oxidase